MAVGDSFRLLNMKRNWLVDEMGFVWNPRTSDYVFAADRSLRLPLAFWRQRLSLATFQRAVLHLVAGWRRARACE